MLINPNAQQLFKVIFTLLFLLEGVASSKEVQKIVPIHGGFYYWDSTPKETLSGFLNGDEEAFLKNLSPMRFGEVVPEGDKKGRILWQSFLLPGGPNDHFGLFLRNVDQDFEVYLDKKMIYKNGSLSPSGQGAFVGFGFHIIELPHNFQGKNIYFRIFSNHLNIGITGTPKIGLVSDLYRYVLNESFLSSIFAVGLMLLGVLGSLFFILFQKKKLLLYASLFSLNAGLYFIVKSGGMRLFFDDLLLKTNMELYLFYLIPVGLMLFTSRLIRYRWIMLAARWAAYAFLTLVGLIALLHSIGYFLPTNFLLFVQVACIIVTLLALGTLCVQALNKTNSPDLLWKETVLFLSALTLASMGGIFQILVAMGVVDIHNDFPIGVMSLFVLALAGFIIVGMRISEELKEKYRLEKKNRMEFEERTSAIATMAGGVAHEINNPLFIVDGYANMLSHLDEDGLLEPERMRDTLLKIRNCISRIKKITEKLLFLSRQMVSIQDGEKDLLVNVLQNVVDSFQDQFEAFGIEVSLTLSHHRNHACHRQAMIDGLSIIVQNAVDAVQKESLPKIDIQLNYQESFVTIAVIDNGPGIPEENLERILLPFFTTKEVGKGPGLGLGIAKHVIEAHEGVLEYSSKPCHTEFLIKFPAA